MKVAWIVEKYIFEDYDEKLIEAIKASGMPVYIFDEMHHDINNVSQFIKKHVSVGLTALITHGSLQLGRQVLRQNVYPGVYLTLDNYECYNYYGYYGDHLLNDEYLMMGLNDLVRNQDVIKEFVQNDNKIFIRPSNGYKTFAGQLIDLENFEQEIDILSKSYGGVPGNTLVVISPQQHIEKEYRFVVIDGKVISGALYMDEENMGTFKPYFDKPCEDKVALDYAQRLADIYHPDKAFTIDVCKLRDGGLKMIEINSLCCASFYGNDLQKIVKAMNELCIEDFKDIYEVAKL